MKKHIHIVVHLLYIAELYFVSLVKKVGHRIYIHTSLGGSQLAHWPMHTLGPNWCTATGFAKGFWWSVVVVNFIVVEVEPMDLRSELGLVLLMHVLWPVGVNWRPLFSLPFRFHICLYCLLFNPYIYSCLISCVGCSSYRPVCLEEAVEVFKDGCEVHYQVSFLTSFILFYNYPLKL